MKCTLCMRTAELVQPNLKHKFLAAKHPANNQAVQRVLLRAAYLQNVDTFSFQSMLTAASTLAQLPVAASSLPRLSKSQQATVASKKASKRSPRRDPNIGLQPSVLPGVGHGVCRIVGEATSATQQRPHVPTTSDITGDTCETSGPHHNGEAPPPPAAQLPKRSSLQSLGAGSRALTYDDVENVCHQVHSTLLTAFSGKVQVAVIGPHRRGAPYSGVVDLLAMHADVLRDYTGDGLLALVEKTNRVLEPHCAANPKVDRTSLAVDAPLTLAGSHVTAAMYWQSTAALTTGPRARGTFAEAPVDHHHRTDNDADISDSLSSSAAADSLPTSQDHASTTTEESTTAETTTIITPRCKVRIRWTTADRFVPQLFLLTGPEQYVSGVLQHASQVRGLDISMQGVVRSSSSNAFHAASPTWLHIPSELSLFAEVRLPYVHPFNRGCVGV